MSITLSRIAAVSIDGRKVTDALPAYVIVYGGDVYAIITNRRRTCPEFWERFAGLLGLGATYGPAVKLWARRGSVVLQSNGLAVVHGAEFAGGVAGWLSGCPCYHEAAPVPVPEIARKATVYAETTKGHQVPIA